MVIPGRATPSQTLPAGGLFPGRGQGRGGAAPLRPNPPAGGLCSHQTVMRMGHNAAMTMGHLWEGRPLPGPPPLGEGTGRLPAGRGAVRQAHRRWGNLVSPYVHLRHTLRIRLFVSHSLTHFPSASQKALSRAGETLWRAAPSLALPRWGREPGASPQGGVRFDRLTAGGETWFPRMFTSASATPRAFVYSFPIRWPISPLRPRKPIAEQVKPVEGLHPPKPSRMRAMFTSGYTLADFNRHAALI